MRVMLVLMLLMRGYGYLVDINGAFLLGNFKQDVVSKKKENCIWRCHKDSKIFTNWRLDYLIIKDVI